MKQCDAPLCDNKVTPDKLNTAYVVGSWPFNKYEHFCPACNERRTNGRFSDKDPSTNPDLERGINYE